MNEDRENEVIGCGLVAAFAALFGNVTVGVQMSYGNNVAAWGFGLFFGSLSLVCAFTAGRRSS